MSGTAAAVQAGSSFVMAILASKASIASAKREGWNTGYNNAISALNQMDEAAAQLQSTIQSISAAQRNKILTDVNLEQRSKQQQAEVDILNAVNGTTGAAATQRSTAIENELAWNKGANEEETALNIEELRDSAYAFGGGISGGQTSLNTVRLSLGSNLGGMAAMLGAVSAGVEAYNR